MCGIAGVLTFEGQGESRGVQERERMVRAMAASLRHRGPDAIGVYSSPRGRCDLGHARLRIIDLHTGEQPMATADGSAVAVFNGEVYNFRELRGRLESRGHTFRSQSDTEVLLAGYREWGVGLFERLEGMFALGLWDEREQALILARDRAGQKPLFVYREDGRLAFASELKALLTLPDLDLEASAEAVPLYLMYGYVPSPGTFYKRIRKHEPAAWTRISVAGVEDSGQYWALDWSPKPPPPGGSVAAVRRSLERAVERRLVSDVPLGAFLSGGVDSTIIVGLMSRLMDQPVKTFSIGFEGAPGYDETSFARLAAERFGTDHTEFKVDPSSIDGLHQLVDIYDEPFGDSSAIPTRAVSRLTREHVTVALTGDGGDELFAGYPRFVGNRVAASVPGALLGLGRGVASLLPKAGHVRSPVRRFVRFVEAASLSEAERTLRWIGFFGSNVAELLHPGAVPVDGAPDLLRSFQRPLDRWKAESPLTRAMALNFSTYLLDDLLVKADRCSMAHSLELRAPFLDSEVMALAAGLRDSDRVKGRRLKWILREAFSDLLPPEIDHRGKMGFGIPLPVWLRGTWRSTVEETLLSQSARILQWVRPEPLGTLVRDHMSGRRDHGHVLWALLTLESWLSRAHTA